MNSATNLNSGGLSTPPKNRTSPFTYTPPVEGSSQLEFIQPLVTVLMDEIGFQDKLDETMMTYLVKKIMGEKDHGISDRCVFLKPDEATVLEWVLFNKKIKDVIFKNTDNGNVTFQQLIDKYLPSNGASKTSPEYVVLDVDGNNGAIDVSRELFPTSLLNASEDFDPSSSLEQRLLANNGTPSQQVGCCREHKIPIIACSALGFLLAIALLYGQVYEKN